MQFPHSSSSSNLLKAYITYGQQGSWMGTDPIARSPTVQQQAWEHGLPLKGNSCFWSLSVTPFFSLFLSSFSSLCYYSPSNTCVSNTLLEISKAILTIFLDNWWKSEVNNDLNSNFFICSILPHIIYREDFTLIDPTGSIRDSFSKTLNNMLLT